MSISDRKTVSKQFAADFAAVTASYMLSDTEIEEAKEAARRDMPAAVECFAALALESVVAGQVRAA